MKPEILQYVLRERVCVFAVLMSDGTPHASTVHVACRAEPFTLIVLTERSYKKGEALTARSPVPASVVMGMSEDNMKTLQLDGTAALTDDESLKEAYFQKFPDKREKYNGPDDIFVAFTPSWWRFTDWTLPTGKTVYLSDGTITVKK